MGLVGVLYLSFERSILSPGASSAQASHTFDSLSRSIIGVQIGLIILSMVVTRSSVISLQSKLGLPLGNQIIGWAVLSKENKRFLKGYLLTRIISCIAIGTIPSQLSAK